MIAKIQFYREEYFAYREVYYAKMQAIQNDHEIYTHIFYNKTPSFNAFTSTFRDEVENTTKSLEFRERRSHVNEEIGGKRNICVRLCTRICIFDRGARVPNASQTFTHRRTR